MSFEMMFNVGLTKLLAFMDPSSRIFVLYLITSFVLAFVAYLQVEKSYVAEDIEEGREPIKRISFLRYVFNPSVWLHPSSIQDMKYFIANSFLYYGLIAQYLLGSHGISFGFYEVLSSMFGVPETALITGTVGLVLYTLASVMALDLGVYVAHRLFHTVPFLWQFHKVHHSAEQLNPMSLFRMHPVDLLITALTVMFFNAIAFGGFFYLTASQPQALTLFGVNFVVFFFYLFGYNLRHSHVWLNYPYWLNKILISPAQHQIHHSTNPKHFDRNMGLIFSIWDQLFGTHYNPKEREELKFGLSKSEPNPFNSVADIYIQPFIWSWAIIKKKYFSTPKKRSVVYASLCITGLSLIIANNLLISHDNKKGPEFPDVRMEQLTWTQIDAAVANGVTGVIIPTGGTEQNGPFVMLGKHNVVIAHTAQKIAKKVGKTMVAPVMAYVPEGDIQPEPTGHMKFKGTLTLPEPVFEQVLIETAKSLKLHGFKDIYLMGDSGSTQASHKRVAEQLTSKWQSEGVKVHDIKDYYSANGQFDFLLEHGFSKEEIGYHAGMRDMSEVMAVHPEGIYLKQRNILQGRNSGQSGDFLKASASIGKKMLSLKIEAATKQILDVRDDKEQLVALK